MVDKGKAEVQAPTVLEEEQSAALIVNRPSRRWIIAILYCCVILVAIGVRHHKFATVHSWFDESLGWRMAQFSPSEIIERSEQNVHPPAHFLLLSAWAKVFGGSLTSLRYYGLFWGILTVVAGGLLASAATNGSVDSGSRPATTSGMFATILISFSSLHIHWSQQVKMYTLGTFLTCLSSYLLLTWMQNRNRWRLVCYVPAAATLTLQHHYGTFTVFGQLTFALIWAGSGFLRATDKARIIPTLVAAWATTSLWSLWLPSFLVQRQLVKAGYWISAFRWEDALNVWANLLTAESGIHVGRDVSILAGQAVIVCIVILLARKHIGSRFVGWLVLIPWLIAVIWSVTDSNVLVPRFLINAHVCLLVGVAVLLNAISNRYLRSICFAAMAGVMLIPAARQRENRTNAAELPGMSEVVRYLDANRGDGEPVLVSNPMLYLNVAVHGGELPEVYAAGERGWHPHFQGTPVMRESEYRVPERLAGSENEWVWTLDAEDWLGGDWKVRVPSDWEVVEENRIKEWYGILVIRLYGHSSQEGKVP